MHQHIVLGRGARARAPPRSGAAGTWSTADQPPSTAQHVDRRSAPPRASRSDSRLRRTRVRICARIAAPCSISSRPPPARASTPTDRCRQPFRRRPALRQPSTVGSANTNPSQLQLRQARGLRQAAEAERQHVGAGQHVRRGRRGIERIVGEHFVADDRPAVARRASADSAARSSRCRNDPVGIVRRHDQDGAHAIGGGAPRSNRCRCATRRDTRARTEWPSPIRAASDARTADSLAAAPAPRRRHRTAA